MGKHKNLTVCVLLILLLQQALFASLALTEEERSYIASRAPVRSVSVDGSGPIQYADSKGEIRGISVRVLEEIENRTGLTFDCMLYEKLGEVSLAYSDGTDILFGIPDQYAQPGYTLSSPFLQTHTILFVNKMVDSKHLENKKFAATLSSALPKGISEEQAIFYYSREDAIKAVDKGEADFGYGNAYSVAFYTLQYGLQNLYTIPQEKEERSYRFLFIKDDPLLVSIMEKALASFTPQELQSITLEATSQVERAITPSLIMNTYGFEILLITILIITILLTFLIIIQNSRTTLHDDRQKFRIIAEVSNEYLFEYDSHHKTVVLYEKFNMLFTTPSSLLAAEKMLKSHLEAYSGQKEIPTLLLQMPSGRSGFFRVSVSKVTEKKRIGRTWIGKLQEITEEVERQDYLKKLAQTDGLTGVLNAATTRHRIEQRLQHKKPAEDDFCILFDLDEFKSINDSNGHLAGDNVLKTIGSILLQGYHSSNDILGRIGGDEFCVYLVAIASEEAALSFCTALMESVRFKLRSVGVTISIGASKVEENETYEELYARVDHALYKAKARGKNRLELATLQTEADSDDQANGTSS